MKQVFLSGQGQIEVFDAPVPAKMKGSVLVRNAYSLISTGTEGAAVTSRSGMAGLYEKAVNSRDRVGQVWQMVQSQGLSNTLSLIQNKLDDYTPLGYSCAGRILEVDEQHSPFKSGQRVACIGTGFANHAEYVVMPKNLVVGLPDNVSYEEASFGALACIAMQGLRRLELSPGESVAIVGLGLIGQLALRLATAMGYNVYGIDIDNERVAHADQYGGGIAMLDPNVEDPVARLKAETGGHGVDGVVICASAKVDSIVNQAFEMCRRRGRVSVVGDIGLGLQRAKMYAKELEVRMSCSYGIGRYDAEYEIKGHDYPLPYVRWTENRNLSFFLQLVSSKRLDLSDLISSKVDVDKAKEAYSLIKSAKSSVYGVLLDYGLPDNAELPANPYVSLYRSSDKKNDKTVRLAMIGVGAYAKNIHMPNILKHNLASIHAVASASGGSAAVAAKKSKAQYATSDVSTVMKDAEVDAVVISTRHASHAKLVLAALAEGKSVFVEKPMATTIPDCLAIVAAQRESKKVVRVGYNRRFSPMLVKMKDVVGKGKKVFNIRVNIGDIGEHWSNTLEEGGRLLGEGVHFFDLANWIMESQPSTVSAHFVGDPGPLNPNATISIGYIDGSVANISYTTLGHPGLGKELFELFGNGRSVVVDDYRTIKAYGAGSLLVNAGKGNKGQQAAMDEFINAVSSGNLGGGADVEAGLLATAIALAAVSSAQTGSSVDLSRFILHHKADQ